jgi:hypothetical protein
MLPFPTAVTTAVDTVSNMNFVSSPATHLTWNKRKKCYWSCGCRNLQCCNERRSKRQTLTFRKPAAVVGKNLQKDYNSNTNGRLHNKLSSEGRYSLFIELGSRNNICVPNICCKSFLDNTAPEKLQKVRIKINRRKLGTEVFFEKYVNRALSRQWRTVGYCDNKMWAYFVQVNITCHWNITNYKVNIFIVFRSLKHHKYSNIHLFLT